ncbi:MAG: ATP-binding cassette domain-containing protein [Ketobacter sp.]|jgi:ATP-binding cassette, subfamily F, member 3|uniref:ATP-binding cassette domain-containing protein n=1 Tax=unclassified Ketobacter TaxID=2639109 RepID=UPI000F26AF8E|nr:MULTISPECIES: ATP-binding cassette domain-containing protein [unclassified Ketobacter]RLT90404.1 MAG: ATP-binding cassette domain-containing protein [Ketobacter sp. GenoA1]RLT99501.1 MAG: ATP-binding cassette domain-containing protein [Ketobacter sp.]|tara:strand:+ start:403 stop:2307 length:1905 start_codon:yes stop_codon:yes gene_type:complete
MIQLQSVNLYRGNKCLLSDATFTAYPGWHIALVGHNGCGKSSLFALLLGETGPDAGTVNIANGSRIAHMAQEVEALDRSALDYVIDGDRPLRTLQDRLQQAELNNDAHTIAQCHQQLDDIDAYSAESRAAKLLTGLGFQQHQLKATVQSFSGGWRMRLNLAQTLMCPSDILLLDEPTNHLDLDAILWLEDWLKAYPGTLILISHDREFIDEITQHVLHIEHQQLNYYSGNYSSFEIQRSARMANQQSAFEKQQREIAHLQQFITRFKAKATKAKQAQSRVKALERMEKIAPAHVDSPFHFTIPAAAKMSDPLLDIKSAELGYNGKPVLQQVSLQLGPANRIGLIGPNGAGKSTLIKTLAATLELVSGEKQLGEHTRIGYFAQHQLDQLDSNATPFLSLQRQAPTTDELTLRKYLGSFGFHGDAVHDTIARFSGGEKARLALALIIWHKPNLLLLDEPTNHLDLEMRLALTLALQEYEGGLVLVSHDRHLLRSTTDELFLVAHNKVEPFNGDLEDYAQWLVDYRQAQQSSNDSPGQNREDKRDKKAERQKAAEIRNQLRPLKNRIQKLEQSLAQLEADKKQIETRLSAEDIYDAANKEQLTELLQRQGAVAAQLEATEMAWLEASETLQTLQQSQ